MYVNVEMLNVFLLLMSSIEGSGFSTSVSDDGSHSMSLALDRCRCHCMWFHIQTTVLERCTIICSCRSDISVSTLECFSF